MPETPTPGQVAYTVWWRAKYGMQQADPGSAYQLLPAADRRAWEAAAQAVRDDYIRQGVLAAWLEQHNSMPEESPDA